MNLSAPPEQYQERIQSAKPISDMFKTFKIAPHKIVNERQSVIKMFVDI